jgi:hypothetical protein
MQERLKGLWTLTAIHLQGSGARGLRARGHFPDQMTGASLMRCKRNASFVLRVAPACPRIESRVPSRRGSAGPPSGERWSEIGSSSLPCFLSRFRASRLCARTIDQSDSAECGTTAEGGAAVLCMLCAFADAKMLLSTLLKVLADVRRAWAKRESR